MGGEVLEATAAVIASAAKQSIAPHKGKMDCFVAFAPRNDENEQQLGEP
jgi:hypothetical protein